MSDRNKAIVITRMCFALIVLCVAFTACNKESDADMTDVQIGDNGGISTRGDEGILTDSIQGTWTWAYTIQGAFAFQHDEGSEVIISADSIHFYDRMPGIDIHGNSLGNIILNEYHYSYTLTPPNIITFGGTDYTIRHSEYGKYDLWDGKSGVTIK